MSNMTFSSFVSALCKMLRRMEEAIPVLTSEDSGVVPHEFFEGEVVDRRSMAFLDLLATLSFVQVLSRVEPTKCFFDESIERAKKASLQAKDIFVTWMTEYLLHEDIVDRIRVQARQIIAELDSPEPLYYDDVLLQRQTLFCLKDLGDTMNVDFGVDKIPFDEHLDEFLKATDDICPWYRESFAAFGDLYGIFGVHPSYFKFLEEDEIPTETYAAEEVPASAPETPSQEISEPEPVSAPVAVFIAPEPEPAPVSAPAPSLLEIPIPAKKAKNKYDVSRLQLTLFG